jgi:NADP-dependent 3-hydroxy acid dehydrogenase YdfG
MMNKHVLITGATSGIGRATAYAFARHGAALMLTGRRKDRLEHIADDLRSQFNGDIQTLAFDVRDHQACSEAVATITSPVDVLINNAGLARGLHPVHEGQLDHWEEMIDTNIKGLLYMTRLISPGMVERGEGHIINVCSTAGHEVYPMGNVYCATKHAVNALTRAMRADLYTHGIRVSQVSPGHVEETEFARVRFDWDEKRASIYDTFNPLKSKDVAEAVWFIASRPAHVNIQDILLMGTQQAGSNLIDRSGRKYE